MSSRSRRYLRELQELGVRVAFHGESASRRNAINKIGIKLGVHHGQV